MSEEAEQTTAVESNPKTSKCHKLASIGITILFIIILAALGFGYQQFQVLKKTVTTDNAEVTKLQQGLAHSQDQQYENKAQIKAQVQTLQELAKTMGYDQSKWRIAEALYLTKLAHFNLSYQHNVSVATTLLKTADNLLSQADLTSLQSIREQLGKVIFDLKALSSTDLANTLLTLNNLQSQVGQLMIPGPDLEKAQRSATTNKKADEDGWREHLTGSLEQLKDLVVVRYHEKPVMAADFPQNQLYLREQLGLFLAQAQWAVLRNQNDLYQSSLQHAQDWLKSSFELHDAKVIVFAESLATLAKTSVDAQYPDLAPIVDAMKPLLMQDEPATSEEDDAA